MRVPIEFGGLGAALRQTFDLLIALAATDSNLPQAQRAHFNLVEDLRLNKDEATKARCLRAIEPSRNSELCRSRDNRVTELAVGAGDRYQTAVTSDRAGLQLNGPKHCTTGALYADHVIVAADQSGKRIAVPLDTNQPPSSTRRLGWLRAFLLPTALSMVRSAS
ncbi:hypothetical protein EAS62_31985 [Bradyrhizobium zhanjiangense]|uniref:Uncharacterized protein n=1 Tax=Bradyrhizobium zhanjiangense TaxID=1325107 RepID=A0ABY0DCI6_9BRAD|nr:hypothetical protein EAS62_31985 [Bradyrhizobium zhanjiangense]